jgi:hypothetical protein
MFPYPDGTFAGDLAMTRYDEAVALAHFLALLPK